MRTPALYDAYADWYENFTGDGGGEYGRCVHDMMRDLLGRGEGACLDV